MKSFFKKNVIKIMFVSLQVLAFANNSFAVGTGAVSSGLMVNNPASQNLGADAAQPNHSIAVTATVGDKMVGSSLPLTTFPITIRGLFLCGAKDGWLAQYDTYWNSPSYSGSAGVKGYPLYMFQGGYIPFDLPVLPVWAQLTGTGSSVSLSTFDIYQLIYMTFRSINISNPDPSPLAGPTRLWQWQKNMGYSVDRISAVQICALATSGSATNPLNSQGDLSVIQPTFSPDVGTHSANLIKLTGDWLNVSCSASDEQCTVTSPQNNIMSYGN